MSRMSRMRKILLSAPGSSRQRPNEPRGTAARDATIRESCPLFQAPWAGTRAAAAIIFCILPILPILSAVPAVRSYPDRASFLRR